VLLLGVLLFLCCTPYVYGGIKRNPQIIEEEDEEDVNLGDGAKQTTQHTTTNDLQDEDVFDDDVFVGKPLKESKKKGDTAQKPVSKIEPEEPETYYWEMAAIAVIVVFAVNFYFGSKANDEIAQKWFHSFFPDISATIFQYELPTRFNAFSQRQSKLLSTLRDWQAVLHRMFGHVGSSSST